MKTSRWAEWRRAVGLFKHLPAVLRAQRDIGRARRLQRGGEYLHAFQLAVCAFGTLSELTAAGHPPASALLSLDTVFLDELARQVGQPGAAREHIAQALQVCEEIAARSPKLAPGLQQHIQWYRHRLATEPQALTN